MKTYLSLPLVGSLVVLTAPVMKAQEPLETLRYAFEDLTPRRTSQWNP